MSKKTKSGKSRNRYSHQYKSEALGLAEQAEELAILKKAAAYLSPLGCFAKSLK